MEGKTIYKLLMISISLTFIFMGIIFNDWLAVTFSIWAVAFTLMMD